MPYSQRQLEQAINWFVRLQANSCSEQDWQRFQQWREKNTAHAAAYTAAEKLWGSLDELKTLDNIPALHQARSAKASKSQLSTAAVLLFVSTLLAGIYAEYNAQTLHYSTQRGEQQHIVLADNSHIELNTDTEIQVKISLLQRHVQLLHGEALFTVAHQAWRPFTVQADNLRIRDIGTRFNVLMQANSVTVAVLEGEVELDDGQSLKRQHLLAGKQGVYTKHKGLSSPETATLETATAWLSGQLVFKQTPLRQVANELERYHGVQFIFTNAELAKETISGTFASADLEPFLHSLETMLPVQVKRQGQRVLLQKTKKK